MPTPKPPANPVAQFIDELLTEYFKDASEAELLHTIAVNIANDDPNKVVDLLVSVHNEIGEFITAANDGKFKEWQPPSASPPESPRDTESQKVLELP